MRRGLAGIEPTPARPNGAGYARLNLSATKGMEIILMCVKGNGAQNQELFRLSAEKVLREFMGDMRLAGHQHFSFHEYRDPSGNWIFAGHANG